MNTANCATPTAPNDECNDNNVCTTDSLTGTSENCNVVCISDAITSCTDGDGCCAPGCHANNDADCAPVCGNGLLEGGETCDGDCPSGEVVQGGGG